MKYNEKYNRWVTTGGLIYRYDTKLDKLVLCATKLNHGYELYGHRVPHATRQVHRIVWETFNGEIPEGMQIDHIDNNRQNNALFNLQLVTPKENSQLKYDRGYTPSEQCRNERSTAMKKVCAHKDWKTGVYYTRSEFGRRFEACYGPSTCRKDDNVLYHREYQYFRKHGYLKGEVNSGNN